MKGIELLKFAIDNNLNAMTFSLEELKEIQKELNKVDELKEENEQLKTNIRKEQIRQEPVHQFNKHIFDECCKSKEILEILRNHLYVASGLVELKITSKQYADMHGVKYHNGIPIVNQAAIAKINDWYYGRDK